MNELFLTDFEGWRCQSGEEHQLNWNWNIGNGTKLVEHKKSDALLGKNEKQKDVEFEEGFLWNIIHQEEKEEGVQTV